MPTVLVTGAAGFIGRNLLESLRRRPDLDLRGYDVDDDPADLEQALAQAEIIFHLAGVNRPPTEAEYAAGNAGFTADICRRLRARNRAPKLVFSSSIQAALDNPYGRSKAAAEQVLQDFARDTGAEVAIYRLPNVFGKWCRPHYNSVTATFCHQIARGLPIDISAPDRELELVYVDDVVQAFRGELHSRSAGVAWKEVAVTHRVRLGRLAEMLQSFQASRETLAMPDLADALARKLYATFLTYLSETELAYALEQRIDDRGTLAEFLKSAHFGQIFISRTKPGVTRGNHYHHTKTEKFLVLDGDALIRLRHVERGDVFEYRIRGADFQVVDIPPGYTHSIRNVGGGELLVLFWASEVFDAQHPDTHFLQVDRVVEESHEGKYDRRHAA